MKILFGIVSKSEAIGATFNFNFTSYSKRFNHYVCRPGDTAPIMCSLQNRELFKAVFGITYWGNKKKMLVHTAPQQHLILDARFKFAIRKNRCLVPATHILFLLDKTAYCCYLKDERPFYLAGLYEKLQHENGETFYSFALVTTYTNKILSVHDINEMPLILNTGAAMKWLRADTELRKITAMNKAPANEQLDFYPLNYEPLANTQLNEKSLLDPQGPSYWKEYDIYVQQELARKRAEEFKLKEEKAEYDAKMHDERLRKMGLK